MAPRGSVSPTFPSRWASQRPSARPSPSSPVNDVATCPFGGRSRVPPCTVASRCPFARRLGLAPRSGTREPIVHGPRCTPASESVSTWVCTGVARWILTSFTSSAGEAIRPPAALVVILVAGSGPARPVAHSSSTSCSSSDGPPRGHPNERLRPCSSRINGASRHPTGAVGQDAESGPISVLCSQRLPASTVPSRARRLPPWAQGPSTHGS